MWSLNVCRNTHVLLTYQHSTNRSIHLKWRLVVTKGGKLCNVITPNVIKTDKKAESSLYCWQRTHALLDVTCLPTFIRASDVFSRAFWLYIKFFSYSCLCPSSVVRLHFHFTNKVSSETVNWILTKTGKMLDPQLKFVQCWSVAKSRSKGQKRDWSWPTLHVIKFKSFRITHGRFQIQSFYFKDITYRGVLYLY